MKPIVLTPQQQTAVENRGGGILVSAAAGSGKTKVLVERVFRYVIEEHYHIDDFLIITYTKAAAAELRGKIAAELSKRIAADPNNQHLKRQLLRVYQADIKTVDAFCTALLRENVHLLANKEDKHALTPDFRVLDEGEAVLVRRRVLDRVLEEFYETMTEGGAQLADTMGAGRDDRNLVDLVLELYQKLQSHAYPNRWLAENKALWSNLEGEFDETPYAAELLHLLRRKGAHWAQRLRREAEQTAGDSALAAGYGEKFAVAAAGFAALAEVSGWEEGRAALQRIEFPRLSTPRGRADELEVLAMKRVWEASKNGRKKLEGIFAVSGEEAMEDLRFMAPAMVALLDLTGRFSEAYRREKLRMNAADFSDQEHLALTLLVSPEGHPTPLGEQIAARYREILVDEYQDTNEVQNAIFRAVSREEKNLFMVGDVKQSIYRFRLADPTIFLGKYRRFPFWDEAEEGEDRKILLTSNFRSRKEILDGCNFIFENILSAEMGEMEYGEEEKLHFGADYYPPRTDCDTEFHLIAAQQKGEAGQENPVKKLTAEARFVAKRIAQLLEEGYPVTESDGTLRPCTPEDIVILMRAPGSRTAAFAEALAERKIPCSFEENTDFFHTMEISVMLALLALIDNPRQDVPLISVLRSPLVGFSPDRLAEIRSASREGDYYDAVAADPGEDCRAFLQTLEQLRQAARDMSVHRLIWYIYNTMQVLGVFGAMEDGAMRRENLIAFSRYAETFENNGYKGIFSFVTHLQRLLDTDKVPVIKSSAAVGGVRLMSIHKSKGLEFPIVILADLDHAFSTQDFRTPVLVHPAMGLGPRCIDAQHRIQYPTLARQAMEERLRRENLAEEQRILYVAMTRPREKLIMVNTVYHGENRIKKLSSMAGLPVEPESVAEATTFGEWLLMAALCRPEAKKYLEFADCQVNTLCGAEGRPWQMYLHMGEEFALKPRFAAGEAEPRWEEDVFDPALLAFAYPHERETVLPAKVTATQLKGRMLDQEIAENAAHTPYLRPLSQPQFRRESHGLTPAERGTATHLLLQYLDFFRTDTAVQLQELQHSGRLSPEQVEAVDLSAVDRFLRSPLAEEIRESRHVLREYRFTLLIDAAQYDPGLQSGEEILLQGVVDCCFETPEGLTVVDFKTDAVWTEEEVAQRAEQYRGQLEAYSRALERVLEKPVVRKVLYFLRKGATVEL